MSSQAQRILVFGCTGTVGQYLVPMLFDTSVSHRQEPRKREAHLIWHHNPISRKWVSQAASCHQVSFEDPTSLEDTLLTVQPSHIVFMLPTRANNRPATQAFICAVQKTCRECLKLIVWISEGDIDNFLQQTLTCYVGVMEAFRDIRESGLPVVRLEPTGFYQNFDKFFGFRKFLNSKETTFRTGIHGTTQLPWIDARDVALAVLNILNDQAETYVGKHYCLCGHQFSIANFVALAAERLGRDFQYESYTREELRKSLLDLGISETAVEDRIIAFMTYHEKHFPVMRADSQPLQALIHRDPTTLLEFWIRHYESDESSAEQ